MKKFKKLRRLIQEEINRQIEQVCDKEADRVMQDIIDTYPAIKPKMKTAPEGYKYYNIECMYPLFTETMGPNNKIVLHLNYYEIRDEKDSQIVLRKNDNYYASFDPLFNNLFINAYVINGQIARTMWDKVAHELYHAFTCFTNTEEEYWDEFKYLDTYCELMKDDNKGKKTIGTLLYLSNKDEQWARANGAYKYVLKHYKEGDGSVQEIFRETQMYEDLVNFNDWMKIFRNRHEYFQRNYSNHKSIPTDLKMNFDEFEKYVMDGYQNYKKVANHCWQEIIKAIR